VVQGASLSRKRSGVRIPSGLHESVAIGFCAMRSSSRVLSFCKGHFSTGRFSCRRLRGAEKGEGALRRSSKGRAFVYRSVMRIAVDLVCEPHRETCAECA
jgi:hypothetical protein